MMPGGIALNAFDWIVNELTPRPVSSDQLVYDELESQSGKSLAIIYRSFDVNDRSHWDDRGSILDFVEISGGGRVLDVGPGDGWPSLPMAPFVESVTGVDASFKRVETCRQNAAKLGIHNADFAHAPADSPLPFPDESFDAVVASSSIEQTPNPRATLCEIYRVLKPGGRLRLAYESLGPYSDMQQELWAFEDYRGTTRLVLYDRRLSAECVVHYGLTVNAPLKQTATLLGLTKDTFRNIPTVDALERLRPLIGDALTCTLFHPGCRTWKALLAEAGFSRADSTHAGGPFAARLYDSIPEGQRPGSLEGLDRYLRPIVREVTLLESPDHLQAPITAEK